MVFNRVLTLAAIPLFLPIASPIALAGSQIASTPAHSTPAASVAQASPAPPPEGEQPNGAQEPRWMDQINLSTAQKDQIKAIFEKSKSDMENLRQQAQQAEEQERSLMAGDASSDQLLQQHQQVQKIHQQVDDQRFQTMLAVREILTPEQRTQLATLMKQHHGGRPPHPPRPAQSPQ